MVVGITVAAVVIVVLPGIIRVGDVFMRGIVVVTFVLTMVFGFVPLTMVFGFVPLTMMRFVPVAVMGFVPVFMDWFMPFSMISTVIRFLEVITSWMAVWIH